MWTINVDSDVMITRNDMFFSGDTCQTIEDGVGFRFEDLRSLFKHERDWQEEAMRGQTMPAALAVKIPDVSTLTVNYRTHNGILAAAAGVVDLLEWFFPYSIDTLPREQGFFSGPKPMLLSETAVDDAAVMIFGADRKHSQYEFGAHQVLLVRSQEAKGRLPAFLNECLAMTILESKGLEFDDVFLWNFLTDSRAKKEWRLVLSFLVQQNAEEHDRLEKASYSERDGKIAGMLRSMDFNEQAHQILCCELKHLYTAITRARVRVIIYDQDAACRAPLFYYLTRRDLCETVSVLEQASSSAKGFAVETSAEEWRAQGKNLLGHKMFQLAAKCFSKCGDVRLENEAKALHLLHVEAPKMRGEVGLLDVYLEAAECCAAAGLHGYFAHSSGKAGILAEKCGEVGHSRKLFELAGNAYVRCSQMDPTNDKLVTSAVHYLCKSGNVTAAVDVLVGRGRFPEAVRLLRDAKHFDEALHFHEKHRSQPTLAALPDSHPLSWKSILQAAASFLAASARNPRNANREASRDRFLKIVARMSPEDEEHHLLTHDFKEELVQRLVNRSDYAKASKLLSAEGRGGEAAKILCETNPCPTAADLELGIELLLAQALLQHCSQDRLKSLMKAQQLQARMQDMSAGAQRTNEEQFGLELFMACIDSNCASKVAVHCYVLALILLVSSSIQSSRTASQSFSYTLACLVLLAITG
jgi:hypothetical protein